MIDYLLKKIVVWYLIESLWRQEFNCKMTIEQRINIKFCVKLGKTVTESLKMLRDVYGDSSMSRTRVFEWHKRYVEGREDVEDDPKSGRPCTSTTDANIEKVQQLVRSDRRLTIRVIATKVGINKEMVRTILVDILGMRKVCAKMVPRLLTEEQKVQRSNACWDILQQLEQTTNSWKTSSQEMSHGSFNMIQKQNNKVTSAKVRSHPDQRRPACNIRKWK